MFIDPILSTNTQQQKLLLEISREGYIGFWADLTKEAKLSRAIN